MAGGAGNIGASTKAQANEFENVWKTAIKNTQNVFANFFTSIATQGLSSFGDFMKGLVNAFLSAVSQMLAADLTKQLLGLFSGGGGGGGLGGILAGLFGGGGGAGGAVSGATALLGLHAGGTVGTNAAYATWPRMHLGGLALRPDEVPAILQRGEQVIPRGSVSSAGGNRQVVVQLAQHFNNYAIDAQGMHELLQRHKQSVGLAAVAAISGSTTMQRAMGGR
jgi:hypothetical protein